MMRRYCLALLLFAAGFAPARGTELQANCGHRGVQIAYTRPADIGAACEALADTLSYFRRIGFELEPAFFLTFADPDKEKPVEGAVSYGYADRRSSTIVVYSSSQRRPWGLPWNSKAAASFLHHELVHMAVWQILGREAEQLRHEWHEFIAYAVQLHLMDPQLLTRVRANFSGVRPFTDFSEVNEFTHGMNPDAFAIAAYLTYRERGAERFVRALLRGELSPPAFSYPFPLLPEQRPR